MIDQSHDKSIVIDVAEEFNRLFSRNITVVAFGEDISDETFEINLPEDKNYYKF